MVVSLVVKDAIYINGYLAKRIINTFAFISCTTANFSSVSSFIEYNTGIFQKPEISILIIVKKVLHIYKYTIFSRKGILELNISSLNKFAYFLYCLENRLIVL